MPHRGRLLRCRHREQDPLADKPEAERGDNKEGIKSLPYVVHPDGKKQAETLDVMKIFAEAGGKMVVDADTRALGDKANAHGNNIDPYLNLDEATRGAFGLTTPQDEAFGKAAEVFKEFATALGDKAFFAGDKSGYGEAWATLEKYHANFAGQAGVKEYLAARGDKCGV